MKSKIRHFLVFACACSFASCAGIPKDATAVKPFDATRYLGKWYEIARFDFRFERNMDHTTATYSLNENGTIRVENQGYDYVKKEWKKAVGVAKFAGDKTEARLKVSFFGPFYSGYNVLAIDKDYKYALVTGGSTDYLWILSREKTIPEDIRQNYLDIARNLGFEVGKLIWVEQGAPMP
ncbi:MAG TPA: lipocalin family protein [Paludibacter sp.]|nr:lipocalin family protein [Paludibacter sp.]